MQETQNSQTIFKNNKNERTHTFPILNLPTQKYSNQDIIRCVKICIHI